MSGNNLHRKSSSGAAGLLRWKGNRLIAGGGLLIITWLMIFVGSSYAGQGEWTTLFSEDATGSGADYTIINKDQTFLMGLTVYRDRVFIRTWPPPCSDTISIEVEEGAGEGMKFGKLYSARDKDCERTPEINLFVIKGDRAGEIIQALKKGAKVVIRDVFRPWEFEPRGTFPLQGFKAAYEQAMQGRVDAKEIK
jgi:hypothetical protein